MERYNKYALLIIVLIMSWLEAVPYYGDVYNTLIERSGISRDTAQTVFIFFYFGAVTLFSFIIKVHNIKSLMYTGTACCLLIVLAGWLFPASQSFYILHVMLGIASASISIVFCYIFIYSFDFSTRIKVTSAFEAITVLCSLLVNVILIKINGTLAFASTCLLLLGLLLLTQRFDPGNMTLPSSIQEMRAPVKIIAAIGFIVLILYSNSGLEYNVLQSTVEELNKAIPWFSGFVLLFQAVVYTVFYFIGNRINRFWLVYVALIMIGVENLLRMIDTKNIVVGAFLNYASDCTSNLFVFSFIGDISLKYGRNFKTAGVSLIACGFGAVFGEFLGKWTIGLIGDRAVPSFAISMFLVFISFLVIPWLAKYINDEMHTIGLNKPEKALEEGANSVDFDNEGASKETLEINYKELLHQKLRKACASLPAGNGLTPREFEIALILLERYDNESIAKMLYISPNTLKVHIRRIYQKFQVTKRKEFIEEVENAQSLKV